MERHKSALKAARQASRRQARNYSARSTYRTAIKKLEALLASAKPGAGADLKKTAVEQLNEVQSILMKAASKNLIHWGKASRKIGRLSARVDKTVSA